MSYARVVTAYDPQRHHRRCIRLRGYDYSRAGAYFVTLCVQNRDSILGRIVLDRFEYSESGCAVADCWLWLAERYAHVELDEYVVMPNHLHGILVILDRDDSGSPSARRKPLGQLIGAFKTVSTQRVNLLRGRTHEPLWQRDFYERIIRNEAELHRIRQYVANNPLQWAVDRENPAATPQHPAEAWQV